MEHGTLPLVLHESAELGSKKQGRRWFSQFTEGPFSNEAGNLGRGGHRFERPM